MGMLGLVLTTCAFGVANDETSPIDLGGLRQVTAFLTISDIDYVVKVRMLPVQTFDAATNARLNREKARGLALQALAKHLSRKQTVEFVVSGAQIETAGPDGKFYALTLRVPREGVSLVRETETCPLPAKRGQERVSFDTSFFTRKRDYLNTLEKLAAALSSDLQKVARKKTTGGSFALVIAEIEERGATNFENLGKEIKADTVLFSLEQEELSGALAKHQERLLEQLKAAVKKHEAEEESP
jgi:hypothetical protein